MHKMKWLVNISKCFFYGNYFYGLCAVALSIEASLQQRVVINPWWYYLAVFTLSTYYYTLAYQSENQTASSNSRTRWYFENQNFIRISQKILMLISLVILILFLPAYFTSLIQLNFIDWVIIFVFPITAMAYYGTGTQNKISLRRFGWIKPFVIGFTWAGFVTIYPILFQNILQSCVYEFTFIGLLLFIKNLMFISMLCVLFDIKDYATDSNQQLKTIVVKSGLRKTIFRFVIPLTIIGLGSFLIYGISHNFHPGKIIMNTIPFLLLICLAYTLHRPRKILYYLVLIDGLMLIKAVCGSVAMILF